MKLCASAAFAVYGALELHKKSPLGFLSVISRLGSNTADSMLSVRDTYRHLEISGKKETAHALKAVYGEVSRLPFKSAEITNRVRRFAADHYIDDRTVYRRLNEARRLYEKLLCHYESLTKK